MSTSTVLASASAPGKVLVIGGYLVVEAPNVGISIGVDARFHADVTAACSCARQQQGGAYYCVTVHSPQFGKTFDFFLAASDTTTTAAATTTNAATLSLWQNAGESKNPFLAHAVLYAIAHLADSRSRSGCGISPADALAELFRGGDHRVASGTKPCARCLTIVLRGANDFYSQQNYLASQKLPVCASSLRLVPPFAPLLGAVSKTGLGSSAALTSSVVAALISYGRSTQSATTTTTTTQTPTATAHGHDGHAAAAAAAATELIHRLAQAAHCVAQGKVGSGFDVYTAVYGTCAYTRFAAARIEPLMPGASVAAGQQQHPLLLPACCPAPEHRANQVDVVLSVLSSVVGSVTGGAGSGEWVPRAVIPGGGAFHGLPPHFRLLLADVHAGGSETPGMVSQIFAWRKTLPDADDGTLWKVTGRANVRCIETLLQLHGAAASDPEAYAAAAAAVSRLRGPAAWTALAAAASAQAAGDESEIMGGERVPTAAQRTNEVVLLFDAARRAFATCRVMLRDVGVAAGVPIEPAALTPLLDGTVSECAGVVAVGCPGAGGFDAVFALAIEASPSSPAAAADADVRCAAVERYWESYSAGGLHVCPLLVREAGCGLKIEA